MSKRRHGLNLPSQPALSTCPHLPPPAHRLNFYCEYLLLPLLAWGV